MKNIRTFENYLVDGTGDEKQQIRDLIRRGRCFVAYIINDERRFAPSRFLGYKENDLAMHQSAKEKDEVDGKDTNPAITAVLHQALIIDPLLNEHYLNYCENLGIVPYNITNRKYWSLTLNDDFEENKNFRRRFS